MLTADIETATADTFEALVLRGAGPIAVEFMSYGCSHCRTIEPVVREAASALASKVRFFRVNVGIDGDVANAYGVTGTPTFVMFLHGVEVGRDTGTRPLLANVVSAVTHPFASERSPE